MHKKLYRSVESLLEALQEFDVVLNATAAAAANAARDAERASRRSERVSREGERASRERASRWGERAARGERASRGERAVVGQASPSGRGGIPPLLPSPTVERTRKPHATDNPRTGLPTQLARTL